MKLEYLNHIISSADGILELMRGQKFRGATGIRNHANYIKDRAGLEKLILEGESANKMRERKFV